MVKNYRGIQAEQPNETKGFSVEEENFRGTRC